MLTYLKYPKIAPQSSYFWRWITYNQNIAQVGNKSASSVAEAIVATRPKLKGPISALTHRNIWNTIIHTYVLCSKSCFLKITFYFRYNTWCLYHRYCWECVFMLSYIVLLLNVSKNRLHFVFNWFLNFLFLLCFMVEVAGVVE